MPIVVGWKDLKKKKKRTGEVKEINLGSLCKLADRVSQVCVMNKPL